VSATYEQTATGLNADGGTQYESSPSARSKRKFKRRFRKSSTERERIESQLTGQRYRNTKRFDQTSRHARHHYVASRPCPLRDDAQREPRDLIAENQNKKRRNVMTLLNEIQIQALMASGVSDVACRLIGNKIVHDAYRARINLRVHINLRTVSI
jgi:hypothetical protein